MVLRLHEKLKSRGHGEIGRTEKRLLYNNGYINQIRSNGDIKLSVLYELADDLGVPVESFLQENEEVELLPKGKKPLLVRILEQLDGPGVSDGLITQLDNERFKEPDRILNRIRKLGRATRAQASDLLAISSSCYIQIFDFNAALWCIQAAIRLDPKNAAHILRKSYLLRTLGLSMPSWKQVELAQALAIDQLDLAVIGESQAHFGFILSSQRAFQEATKKYTSALRYERWVSERIGSSVHQGIAFALGAQGDRAGAAYHYGLALELAHGNPEFTAKIYWALAFNQSSASEAAKALERSLEIFPDHCFVDRSLATIDLIECYLELGEELKAKTLVLGSFQLLEKLATIPGAEGAFADLIRHASDIGRSALIRARSAIEGARARLLIVPSRQRYEPGSIIGP